MPGASCSRLALRKAFSSLFSQVGEATASGAHLCAREVQGVGGRRHPCTERKHCRGVRKDPQPRDELGNPVAATRQPGNPPSPSSDPAPPLQYGEGGGSPQRTGPPPTRARGAAQGEEGSLHPSQAALCGAVTRNPPPPPRPPPEPRAPHLGARARRCAPPRAAGASPEPRAARTGQQDPRREPQPPLGRRRRRRRFRPCHGVTRGGRSRRDQGGVGSPPSPSPRRSPRPGHFRRCASRGAWGGGRGLCAREGEGAGPGAGRAGSTLGASGCAGTSCRLLAPREVGFPGRKRVRESWHDLLGASL